jgi:hypothetical protein
LTSTHIKSSLQHLRFWIPFLIGLLVIYKAIFLSFTHDEALSFQIVLGNTQLLNSANHHLLNTWLMQFFALFSLSEWCLRLPAIIGFVLYAFFLAKLIKIVHIYFQLLFFFPLLYFNTYLLDFFSLARGYGLSVGLATGALYFLLQTPQQFIRNSMLSMLMASLATLANLNLINFYIMVVLILLVRLFFTSEMENKWKRIFGLILTLYSTALLIFLLKRLLMLKELGELYYGNSSLIDGFNSLIIWSLDFSVLPDALIPTIDFIILAMFIIAGVLILVTKQFGSNMAILFYINFGITLGLCIEHFFFQSLFPQNRTAVYLIPLLVLFAGSVLGELGKFIKADKKVLVFLALILVTLPVMYQFQRRLSLNSCFEWNYDAFTKQAAIFCSQTQHQVPIKVAHNWVFGPALSYYVTTQHLPLQISKLEEADLKNTQLIIDFCDKQKADSLSWKLLNSFGNEQMCIYNTE